MTSSILTKLETISLRGQNKTAVIIGGTTGIGPGVAVQLAKVGCSRIILVGRREDKARLVEGSIKVVANADVVYVKGDLS
jgi:short-subunit dehydrogenase